MRLFRIAVATAALLILLLALGTVAHNYTAASRAACSVRWDGEIDADFLKQARADLTFARRNCDRLTVALYSPGGSVVDGLEIVREMQAARHGGLVIEIRGGAVVASMATVLLSAGTPGHRLVDARTLTVIHGIQSGFFESKCTDLSVSPQTEDEKITNQLIRTLADVLSETTGKSPRVTRGWLRCGREQVGEGALLVRLGFADRVL